MKRKQVEPPTTTDEDIDRIVSSVTRNLYREVILIADRAGLVAEASIRFGPVALYCRHARETHGESLKDAAKALRVPQYRLNQIEDCLPLEVEYSMLVRYVSHLGLEPWFDFWERSNAPLVALLLQPVEVRETLRTFDLDALTEAHLAGERSDPVPRPGAAPVIPMTRGSKAGIPTERFERPMQLEIVLEGIEPPIWRRIVISSSATLHQLHRAIQVAMGWENAHLYTLTVGGRTYSDPTPWDDRPSDLEDSRKVRLAEFQLAEGATLEYEYDMGDGWRHRITVERPDADSIPASLPACLAGARACPPEDSGGPIGYEEILAAIRNPKHPERRQILGWLPRGFDSERFDRDRVNDELRRSGGGNRKTVPVRAN